LQQIEIADLCKYRSYRIMNDFIIFFKSERVVDLDNLICNAMKTTNEDFLELQERHPRLLYPYVDNLQGQTFLTITREIWIMNNYLINENVTKKIINKLSKYHNINTH
jgi:hypothetical protein